MEDNIGAIQQLSAMTLEELKRFIVKNSTQKHAKFMKGVLETIEDVMYFGKRTPKITISLDTSSIEDIRAFFKSLSPTEFADKTLYFVKKNFFGLECALPIICVCV